MDSQAVPPASRDVLEFLGSYADAGDGLDPLGLAEGVPGTASKPEKTDIKGKPRP